MHCRPMAAPAARPFRCGVFLPLVGLDWTALRARAALVERLGFDSLWLDDHFWFPGAPDRPHLEVCTALAALAASTGRLTLGPLVLCQSYRSPALVAKMAASLAQVSADRFVLGLGIGWMEEEYRAYGYPWPKAGTRIAQLGEVLEIVRRMSREERASFRGRYHAIADAPSLPKPGRLPILVGGAGDRVLQLVARFADAWNCPNPAWRELAAKRDALRRHCDAIGRDPAEVEISEQVIVVVGRSDAEVAREKERAMQCLAGFARFDGDCHVGTPPQIVEALLGRRALGVDTLLVMFGDFGGAAQLELFAHEVLPAVRAMSARA
jgi:alkanesulfonate monooxygenase SsuD/methylene tetrahydromethanopterin reductase-like flavin-dependent oxidoreductase (luciferase family)